ncbi:hypothetical protein Gorai_016743 [Gossypium raimondii]|uniref:RNase H type-1 domain-containing protein n=1 Tax=Gossypium raimondii TaxID=29730 RepID=A0A7J8P9P4_GOSRA|nr:hypothetical protein [Gossypium raimondii]
MLISRPILRLALPLLLKPLQNGLGWLVGDGTSIKICNDNWGFEGLNGDSLCPTLLSDNEILVSELWNHNFTGWNKERVKELFGSTIGDQCGKEEETLIHALKDCPQARAILTFGGLDNKLLERDYSCCIDWIEDIMRTLDMNAVVDFFTTLWNSWNNMNNFIFRGQDEDAKTKPPCSFAKINFNATVANEKMGYGVIVRDADDFVLSGSGGFKEAILDIEWAKLMAFEESVKSGRGIKYFEGSV